MKKVFCIILSFLFLLPCFAGAETIVTSFYPIWLMTLNLTEGMEDVSVVNLAGQATGCLHDYTLQNSDMVTLSGADALLINGAGMESFLPVVTGAYPQPVFPSSVNPKPWKSVRAKRVRRSTPTSGWIPSGPPVWLPTWPKG